MVPLISSMPVAVTTLFTYWNAELLIAFLCNILSACMASYWLTVCALIVKANSFFELHIGYWFHDIFFHLNANFTLILTKRLQFPQTSTGAPPLDSAGGLTSPDPPAMPRPRNSGDSLCSLASSFRKILTEDIRMPYVAKNVIFLNR